MPGREISVGINVLYTPRRDMHAQSLYEFRSSQTIEVTC